MISGFAFAGYRSFHGNLEPIGPMGKVHLIIGQNNSGKSNVLRFAQTYLPALAKPENFGLPSGLDLPRGSNVSTEFAVAIPFAISTDLLDSVSSAAIHHQYRTHARNAVEKLLRAEVFALSDDEFVWIRCQVQPGARAADRFIVDPEVARLALEQALLDEMEITGLRLFCEAVAGTRQPSPEVAIAWILTQVDLAGGLPNVATIAALRSITEGTPDEIDHSGRGLIKRLSQLERPGMSNLDDRDKFREINEFVATVLEDPTARITVPADQNVIHVIAGGVELPLEHLGTGLHEVIIIAAAATVLENHLVCIEEPEVHLHPVLQRRLLSYLANHTSNQYLIATHSAHMLDANLASVTHVMLDGTRSITKPASKASELASISADLGYRPSDLLQANSIIWVEGPSDRIYLSKWISCVDPGLIEGVHYSLMFYGGSLLNRLTASDQELSEFIDLRTLNHNLAIVIDSDRKRAGERLNETKLRVKREFDSDEVTGVAWITHGYTIENYVPPERLSAAAAIVNPGRSFRWNGARHENPLPSAKGQRAYDKTAIARVVTESWDDTTEWRDDLALQVNRLVTFIRTANR